MITFRSYASGSTGNLYTVTDGKTTVMLECGLPWKKIRQLLGFKTSGIAGILITHFHLDHSRAAVDAMKSGMDIYASRETFEARNLSGHRCIEIEDKKQFSIGTWKVLPFETIHDTEGSLGFYMANEEGEAFLFMTDTAYAPVRFKNLSVIACECNNVESILADNIASGAVPAVVGRRVRRSHMSLGTLIDLLKANNLERCTAIYLLHLSSQNSSEEQMKLEVQRATGIPTYIC